MRPAAKLNRDDEAVLLEVARTIEQLHARGMGYAEIFSPLHDDGVAELARRNTVLLRTDTLGPGVHEIVTPPTFGRYVMTIASGLDTPRRRFATRHGLGHVVAGHVSELSLLSTVGDWTTHEERVADTFAMADLFPFWMLDDLRKARSSWGALRQALCRSFRMHTADWPEERVVDRADLRLALYRVRGL